MIGQQILPNDIKTENALIAYLINNPYQVSKVFAILDDTEVFYNISNKIIFEIILEFNSEKKPIDALILTKEIKSRKIDIEISYVLNILNNNNYINYQEYSLIILDKFLKRKAIEIGYKIVQKSYEDEENIIDIISEAVKELDKINYKENKDESNQDIIIDYLDKITSGEIQDIPTGFQKLDTMIDGLTFGHYNIIGARPKMGKTTFVINLIYQISIQFGIPVAFYSLEERKEEILLKLLSRHLSTSRYNIKENKLTLNQEKKKNEFIENLDNYKINIVDDMFSMNAIINDIINSDEKIIFIDYNEYIQTKSTGLYDRLMKVSNTFTKLAKKHNKCIIMIQQVHPTDDKDKKPKSSDIYMKVGVKDASKVMLLHGEIGSDERTLIVTENRYGNIGEIEFEFIREKSTFKEKNFYSQIYGGSYD